MIDCEWRRGSKSIDPDDEDAILADAILRLPRLTRDVFLLHRIARLDYDTIGMRLGLTADAVRAHVARALLRLLRVRDRVKRTQARLPTP